MMSPDLPYVGGFKSPPSHNSESLSFLDLSETTERQDPQDAPSQVKQEVYTCLSGIKSKE